MEVRWMTARDLTAVQAASHLFDGPVEREFATTFLNEPTHHLAISYVDNAPAGFVSGVEVTHPDKRTEMFLYELGVDEAFQRRGIGTALVAALRDLAAERGCRGMWVLTEDDNAIAQATYRAAGAGAPEPQVLLEWTF